MSYCGDIQFNLNKFLFISYDRTIVLSFCFISFILYIIIIISIYLARYKKISIVIRITGSILIVNFINIFSYSFQWVRCKEKLDNNKYRILFLVEKANIFLACKIQSFILLSSSLSQDYLIILFFFVVNKKKMIKMKYINIFIILSIIFPFIISLLLALFKVFGVNDDFCYIKKYNHIENNEFEPYKNYNAYCIIYGLKMINFSTSIFLLIKIIKYIQKEKSIYYIINKLSMLFIQLFKLFIILLYRILDLCLLNTNEVLTKLYIILSTIDGLLIPLAFSFSNEIYSNYCIKTKTRNCTETDKDFEEDRIPNMSLLPNDDEDITKINTKASGIYTSIFNSNNFDLSYDEN